MGLAWSLHRRQGPALGSVDGPASRDGVHAQLRSQGSNQRIELTAYIGLFRPFLESAGPQGCRVMAFASRAEPHPASIYCSELQQVGLHDPDAIASNLWGRAWHDNRHRSPRCQEGDLKPCCLENVSRWASPTSPKQQQSRGRGRSLSRGRCTHMMPLLPEKYVAPSSIQGSTGTHVRMRRTFARVGWSGPDSAGLEISHRRELASSQWVCGPQLQPPGTSIAPELCPAGHDTMHHHRVGSTGLEKSVPRMRRKSTFGELSVLGLPVKVRISVDRQAGAAQPGRASHPNPSVWSWISMDKAPRQREAPVSRWCLISPRTKVCLESATPCSLAPRRGPGRT